MPRPRSGEPRRPGSTDPVAAIRPARGGAPARIAGTTRPMIESAMSGRGVVRGWTVGSRTTSSRMTPSGRSADSMQIDERPALEGRQPRTSSIRGSGCDTRTGISSGQDHLVAGCHVRAPLDQRVPPDATGWARSTRSGRSRTGTSSGFGARAPRRGRRLVDGHRHPAVPRVVRLDRQLDLAARHRGADSGARVLVDLDPGSVARGQVLLPRAEQAHQVRRAAGAVGPPRALAGRRIRGDAVGPPLEGIRIEERVHRATHRGGRRCRSSARSGRRTLAPVARSSLQASITLATLAQVSAYAWSGGSSNGSPKDSSCAGCRARRSGRCAWRPCRASVRGRRRAAPGRRARSRRRRRRRPGTAGGPHDRPPTRRPDRLEVLPIGRPELPGAEQAVPAQLDHPGRELEVSPFAGDPVQLDERHLDARMPIDTVAPRRPELALHRSHRRNRHFSRRSSPRAWCQATAAWTRWPTRTGRGPTGDPRKGASGRRLRRSC